MKFQYKPVQYNYSSRGGSPIRFIVVHDTGNYNKGADALAHYRFFNGGKRGASAHYFVDDKGIVQIIGDSLASWHCGDRWARKYATRNDVTNSNSIGVEMCMNPDSNYADVYKNTVELVKNLMVKFNIPADRVVRHFDASGKSCPNHMKPNNWQKWWQFKEDIKRPIVYKIDLSKDSTFGLATQSKPTTPQPSTPKLSFEDEFIKKITDSLKGQNLNVLPSVTTAQAILESNWGRSGLSANANNLFGIKASKDWTGAVYNASTKEQTNDGTEYRINANFRKYNSILDSIKDHDNFFVSTPWRTQNYQRVLNAKDYKEQAQALQDCGYATDKQYAKKLISLIERYNLQRFDKGGIAVDTTNEKNIPSKWAEKEWQEGIRLGITDGTSPKRPATREEVVAMILRTLKTK